MNGPGGRSGTPRRADRLVPLLTVAVLAAGVLPVVGCATGGSDGDGSGAPPVRPVLVIAHRGASSYAPSDTLPSIRQARKRDADVVEVDVRQTRDRVPVALFDASLAPTTNVERVFPDRRPWRVGSFTLPEIRRLDAGSSFGPAFAGTGIPTLNGVVRATRRLDLGLIVEIKTPQRYPDIAHHVLRELRSHPGWPEGGRSKRGPLYLEVESFDWALIRRLDRQVPQLWLGLAGPVPPTRLTDVAAYADAVNPQHSNVDAAYIEQAHRAGLDVKLWSVNDPHSARRAIRIGADGIYSHRPDMVRRVLSRSASPGRGGSTGGR